MSAKTIDRIAPGIAAIDIGSEKHFVATADQPVRAFASFTADLQKLSAYLRERQVTKVAMEATGTYWMPLYDALQQKGLEVTVFNGAHARNLPGRKSDVKDSEWHAMLHSHGLLQPCFVTPELMRPLRTYVRRREELLGQGAEHIQHMQRACDQMNLRLHTVISQIQGVSGLRVIKAILEGERNPQRLVELCDMRIRRKKEKEVLASLEGTWHPHHLFELQQAYDAYHFCQKQIAACDREIEAALRAINAACPPEEALKGAKPMRHNVPQVDNLYGHLLRLSGHDAQAMAGLTCTSWLKLTSELGSDLSHWQSEKHFTSWLGLAPGRAQSGRRCRRIRRARTRVGQIFRECALGLAASKHNTFGAFYRRVKAKHGAAVAIVALARKLAVMYWRIMVKGVAYVEEGLAKYEERLKAQGERFLRKLATEHGYTLTKNEEDSEKAAA